MAQDYTQALVRYALAPPPLEDLINQRRETLARAAAEDVPNYDVWMQKEERAKEAKEGADEEDNKRAAEQAATTVQSEEPQDQVAEQAPEQAPEAGAEPGNQ